MSVPGHRRLAWPHETARPPGTEADFRQPDSNVVLDFHGDPLLARLVVFSDGNHHMALQESLAAFLAANPGARDVFYATTPPRVLVGGLRDGAIRVGNLILSARPHVFIGPGEVLDRLIETSHMRRHAPFMQSRGNVFLVRHGNPKGITGLADLLRADVRLALSNPKTEAASHMVYRETILGLAEAEGQDGGPFRALLDGDAAVHSELIHHREIPEMLAADRADVAVLYFHLALRYIRIFGELFEIVPISPLSGEAGATKANRTTRYHIGLIGTGGDWGPALLDFMTGPTVADIYRRHGLEPAAA